MLTPKRKSATTTVLSSLKTKSTKKNILSLCSVLVQQLPPPPPRQQSPPPRPPPPPLTLASTASTLPVLLILFLRYWLSFQLPKIPINFHSIFCTVLHNFLVIFLTLQCHFCCCCCCASGFNWVRSGSVLFFALELWWSNQSDG